MKPQDEGATAPQDALSATPLAGVRRHSCLSKSGCQACSSMNVPHFMASQEKDSSGCRDSFPSARGSFILTHVV